SDDSRNHCSHWFCGGVTDSRTVATLRPVCSTAKGRARRFTIQFTPPKPERRVLTRRSALRGRGRRTEQRPPRTAEAAALWWASGIGGHATEHGTGIACGCRLYHRLARASRSACEKRISGRLFGASSHHKSFSRRVRSGRYSTYGVE